LIAYSKKQAEHLRIGFSRGLPTTGGETATKAISKGGEQLEGEYPAGQLKD